MADITQSVFPFGTSLPALKKIKPFPFVASFYPLSSPEWLTGSHHTDETEDTQIKRLSPKDRDFLDLLLRLFP